MDHGVYYCLVALLPLLYLLLKSAVDAPFGSGTRHGVQLPPGPWQLPLNTPAQMGRAHLHSARFEKNDHPSDRQVRG
jgi:hypothetical protein